MDVGGCTGQFSKVMMEKLPSIEKCIIIDYLEIIILLNIAFVMKNDFKKMYFLWGRNYGLVCGRWYTTLKKRRNCKNITLKLESPLTKFRSEIP